MREFIDWITKEQYKIIIYVLVIYIPLWIMISSIWQLMDEDHVDLTEFLLIQGIVVLTIFFIIIGIYRFVTRSRVSYNKLKYKSNPIFDLIYRLRVRISDFIFNWKHKDEMYVEDLGWVMKCCNQTARLGERYCVCGRAVTKELYQLYSI